MGWLEPLTLADEYARLVPLSQDHHDDLCDAVRDGALWNLWYTSIPSPGEMRVEIKRRLALQDEGAMLPFAVCRPSGEVVGMTTYMNLDPKNRRVEIGATWYAKSSQQTRLNTGCKLLLLRHAFEKLNCIAVEFRTHFFNSPSRRAIERLGAKLDGVLRNHTMGANGTLRDTCVYSILPGEWPTVEANLRYQLTRLR